MKGGGLMAVTMRLEGFSELAAELEQLGRLTTQKASLRRALRKSAEPLASLAQANAPVGDTRTLAPSIAVSTKLSKRQAAQHRRMFRNDRAAVEMFVGAGPLSSAHTQEFGTVHHAAQPYLRPAWDEDKEALLGRLRDEIAADIKKAVARAERRAARLARRG